MVCREEFIRRSPHSDNSAGSGERLLERWHQRMGTSSGQGPIPHIPTSWNVDMEGNLRRCDETKTRGCGRRRLDMHGAFCGQEASAGKLVGM